MDAETMFKRILVPVDPARPFGAANEYACRLAQRFQASVIANYIVDEELVAGVGEAVGALDEAMEWVGRDAMEDFVRLHPDLEVEKRMSYGHTATVIFQSVLRTGADLVVVGGYRGLQNPKLWGSTVQDIVEHDERPTFVVRKNARLPEPGQRIVVPFDGSQRPVENLAKICRFAKELGVGIDLVYVAKKRESEAALHLLEKGRIQAEGEGVDVETHCLEASFWRPAARIILAHARRQKTPLIALSRLGRTGIVTGQSPILNGLLAHSEIPVWVVRR